MNIYTKSGDKGYTTRYDGAKVMKNDFSILLVGKLDNLMASLDSAHITVKNKKIKNIIDNIQSKLWQTAGEISLGKPGKKITKEIQKKDIIQLEKDIDEYSLNLTYFVRFRTEASTRLNEARVRCRELEVPLTKYLKENKIRPEVYQYINRLSDLLYVLACHQSKKELKPNN